MNVRRTIKSLFAAGFALLLVRGGDLFACAACYGQSDSQMARSMNWGIFTLLGVIGCVLAGITAFFVHIGRKSSEKID